MAKWKANHNPDPLIQRLNKCKSIDESGNVTFSGFDFSIIPSRLDAMIELSADIPEYQKYSIVKQALWTAGKRTITKDSFLIQVRRLEGEYLKAPEKKYVLATALSIDHRFHELHNTVVNNSRITFSKNSPLTFAKARRTFAESLLNVRVEYPTNYTTVRICTSAKTCEDAGSKALYNLDLIRGFLNLSINSMRGHSFSVGMRREPINQIVLAPMHTLHEQSGKLATEMYWYQEDYIEPVRVFYEPVVSRFEKVVDFVQKMRSRLSKCNYRRDIEDAVVRYNDALDSRDWNTGYIKLWSVLELLTNTLKNSYETTIRRAAFIYEDYANACQLLLLLRDFRNELVHRGSYKTTIEVFIDDLRQFVQQLLFFLIFNRFKFESLGEVADFFDQPRDSKVILKKLKLLNCAQKCLNKMIIK